MGREIRRVPPNYEHPKDDNDQYISLLEQNYQEARDKWVKGLMAWEASPETECDYWEDYGGPPKRHEHIDYSKDEATWFQVYETVSEGTPVSPPFETPEELVDHMVYKGTDWDGRWARDQAEAFVASGWAPSLIVTRFEEGTQVMRPSESNLVEERS